MTYRELWELIIGMTDAQLDRQAMVGVGKPMLGVVRLEPVKEVGLVVGDDQGPAEFPTQPAMIINA